MRLLAAFLCAAVALPAAGEECTYEYSVWNTRSRRSEMRRTVRKPRSELTREEQGPLGCTPCREDQTELALSNGLRFSACVHVAAKVKAALDRAIAHGQEILTVVGYRPQMSRGPVDAQGNRTELSNHSFGVAVDVNEEQNGLYDACLTWSSACRLRKGGPYRPGSRGSIVPDGPLVAEMQAIGFEWGGRIAGRQKDFMHFSPTGY